MQVQLWTTWKYLTIQHAAQMAQAFYHGRPNVGTDWMMSDVKTGGIFRADHLFEGVLTPQITANSKAWGQATKDLATNKSGESTQQSHRPQSLKKTLVRHELSLLHSLQQQQQQLSPQSYSLILGSHIHFPSSEFSIDESLVRSASCNQISGIPSLDATMNQQNPTVRPRPLMQKLRTNAAKSNGEFGEMFGSSVAAGGANGPGGWSGMGGGSGSGGGGGGGGTMGGGGPGLRGKFEDQPRECLATHLHGQNATKTAKMSPHPATLGAPLKYVKLARTKGAKLLRAYETLKTWKGRRGGSVMVVTMVGWAVKLVVGNEATFVGQ
ncbi:hypothetical protein PCASD_00667 [Puccinia coronata f. sp. avenae]|uniref:Uncharacterized protein n=1 Tax=Puccinia coronata f. sp. avenae TaxID=200324 RepID=A0A2N5VL49_9BASI|nr:hypothetical protein PCASD_00667 [Puccinia coronata f. sp. avenae]